MESRLIESVRTEIAHKNSQLRLHKNHLTAYANLLDQSLCSFVELVSPQAEVTPMNPVSALDFVNQALAYPKLLVEMMRQTNVLCAIAPLNLVASSTEHRINDDELARRVLDVRRAVDQLSTPSPLPQNNSDNLETLSTSSRTSTPTRIFQSNSLGSSAAFLVPPTNTTQAPIPSAPSPSISQISTPIRLGPVTQSADSSPGVQQRTSGDESNNVAELANVDSEELDQLLDDFEDNSDVAVS
jgi:hypothetical protein